MRVASAFADPRAVATARLVLPYDARRKSRLLARLDSGEEVGYVLPPGTVLRAGAKLAAADGAVIEIVAAVEPLLEVRAPADRRLIARAAYHIGNRHVALEVGDGYLRMQRDHVLADMLIGLGCTVQAIEAPFDPEGGAYPSHHHDANDPGHGAHRSSPKIHQFR